MDQLSTHGNVPTEMHILNGIFAHKFVCPSGF